MAKKELIVFYDSWCPLCTAAKKAISKHDRKKRITFLTFRDADTFTKYHLEDKQVEIRLYGLDPITRRSFSGIESIYEIAKRVPFYRGLVPFFYLSIKLGFGHRVYDFIATRRKIIPAGQCNDGSCPIHSDREQIKKDGKG